LRLVQIDFADQGDEVRRGYLVEELRRAMSSIVPSERKAFLDDLQSRFPTWDGTAAEPTPAVGVTRGPTEDQLKDPSFLVSQLISLRNTLSEQQRRTTTEQLQQAGFLGTGGGGLPPVAMSELAAKLKLAPRDQLDSQRVLELMTQLVDIMCSLDRVIWRTWQTAIAPQSSIRCPSVLEQLMARFVTGSPMVSRQQMIEDTNMLRQLVAALVAAIAQTGQFAVENLRAMSPEEVRATVGSVTFNAEARYWRKYVELFESNDVSAVDNAMRKSIADFAEKLIRGRRANI
ncbi:MAG TPA: hypothetical protein VIM11_05025, partial [Tepidisphaeraceae bacterium]